MKYRARMDLSFNDHNDAASLYAYAKNISAKATVADSREIDISAVTDRIRGDCTGNAYRDC